MGAKFSSGGGATVFYDKTDTPGEIVTELVNASDGAGLHFDGAAGNIDIPGSGSAPVVELGTKFSFEFIIQADSWPASGSNIYIVDFGNGGRFVLGNPLTGNFSIRSVGSSWSSFGASVLDDLKVHHIVVTVDGTSAVAYDNGNQIGTATITSPNIDDCSDARIASDYVGTASFFNGTIYRARFYNKALEPDEVQTAYERADVDFADQYGSQTKLIDSDFNGSLDGWNTSNDWATQTNNSNAMQLAADAANQICRTGTQLAKGKRYRVTYTASAVTGTPGFSTAAATHVVAGVISAGTANSFEFTFPTSATSQYFYIKSNTSEDAVTLDDISVVQIGAVSDYDLAFANENQSRMVADRSTNNVDGEMSSSGVKQTQVIKQLNSTAMRVGGTSATAATPADGEVIQNQSTILCADAYAAGLKLTRHGTSEHAYIVNKGGALWVNAKSGNSTKFIDGNDNANVHLEIKGDGNVGISQTPSAWAGTGKALQLAGASHVVTANNYAYIGSNYYYENAWKYTTAAKAALYTQSDGTHDFRVAAAGSSPGDTIDSTGGWNTALTINNSGAVGFGVTSGQQSASSGSGGLFYNGAGSYLSMARSGDTAILVNRISDTGEVIEFRKDGTDVGNISVTASATAFNTSSDYRLKENLTPLTGALDRLDQLPVYRFNFKSDPDTTVDGFVAHEVSAHVPEAVTGEKDAMKTVVVQEAVEAQPATYYEEGDELPEGKVVGDEKTPAVEAVEEVTEEQPDYQGIDQSKLVPLLVAAVKELKAKVETLENA